LEGRVGGELLNLKLETI